MAVCAHRPQDGASLKPCNPCKCAAEVLAEEDPVEYALRYRDPTEVRPHWHIGGHAPDARSR